MTPPWVSQLSDEIIIFLETLEEGPGRFRLCRAGLTSSGRNIELGFSCLALRTYAIVGAWEGVDRTRRRKWIRFIQGFQDSDAEGGFTDPALLGSKRPLRSRIREALLGPVHPGLAHERAIINAETKQALATLQIAGSDPVAPIRRFPEDEAGLRRLLSSGLNWDKPWAAGGQASALAAFINHAEGRIIDKRRTSSLKRVFRDFLQSIHDERTGSWFTGKTPPHGDLVNGSMKVINALEWVGGDIPSPERLIDTCLEAPPKREGCHLLDAVYVLYHCVQCTDHRESEVRVFLSEVLESIRDHRKPSGGFSYYKDRNQTQYYGAKIAESMSQPDLHGTSLFALGIAMIGDVLDWDDFGWRYYRT